VTQTLNDGGGSNIFDLGYRRYEEERLGRGYAMLALYIESLRGAFGLGRSTAAKIAPFALIAVAVAPAFIAVVIASLFDLEVLPAIEYYAAIKYVIALYCAVVAPDIAGRDQRNRSLTLYFSRAISRSDYALAKLAAMVTAMLMVTLVPQLVLLIGNGLTVQDFGAYLRAEWDQVFAILGSALLGSALIASIGVAIAAFTPQRAFATVGIIVAFILPVVVVAIIVFEIAAPGTRSAIFASPLDLVDGLTAWIFGEPNPTGIARPDDDTYERAAFDLWAYGLAASVVTLVASALLVRRYQTVQA
jgi:ABC-2 type transport system permease protein